MEEKNKHKDFTNAHSSPYEEEQELQRYKFFIEHCTSKAKSIKNYTDFKRINECIEALGINGYKTIFDFSTPYSLEEGIKLLNDLPLYIEYNKKGNNQYSNTVLTYQQYLYALELSLEYFNGKNPLSFTSSSPSLPPLDQPLQQIFYGAPGTGKSHTIKKTTDGVDSKFVVRTTFHPDSDYSTFVGAYKPQMRRPERIYGKGVLTTKLKEMKDAGVAYPCHKFAAKYWESVKKLSVVEIKEILKECDIAESMEVEIKKGMAVGESLCNQSGESKIVYAYTPQAFTKAYITAWQNPEQPVYLIIEEINRGNCAQIFGDLFQLLDRGDDGLSCYPIKADQDMQMHLMEVFAGNDALPENIRSGEELVLPSNLYIWATMNTSDQSLFPIDSAFKRRWEWKYIPITQGKDKESGKLMQWSIEAEGVRYDWWSFLEVMNKRVGDITSSEDKKLGFFFCKADGQGVISADKFVSKVLFYLWNDVFKDYPDNPIAMYLKEDGGEFTYGDFYTTNPQGDVVVREELVTRLLDALGVKVNFENEDKNLDDEEGLTQRRLKVEFPNGEIFDFSADKTLIDVLNYIGPANIPELGFTSHGYPIISRSKITLPDPNDKDYKSAVRFLNGQRPLNDGYYVFVKTSVYSKESMLNEISDVLGLGLKVSIVG